MFYALNSENKKVSAIYAIKGNKYICPLCNNELFYKSGEFRRAHFSHYKGALCDTWNHDEDAWVDEWKLSFPEELVDCVLKNNDEKHFIDILSGNCALMFLPNLISEEELNKRNEFLNNCNKKTIVLLNFINKYSSNRIVKIGNKYESNKAIELLNNYLNMNNLDIYIQLFNENDNTPYIIEKINKVEKDLKHFTTSTQLNKEEFIELIVNNNLIEENEVIVSTIETTVLDDNIYNNELIVRSNNEDYEFVETKTNNFQCWAWRIMDLYNQFRSRYESFIVSNINNGNFYLIQDEPLSIKNNIWYGYKNTDKTGKKFSKEPVEIPDSNLKVWRIVVKD